MTRLLYYQKHIPRSVLVDYLKTLFAFHLALYHLRLLKILPLAIRQNGQIVREFANEDPLSNNPSGTLKTSQIGIIVDLGDVKNEHMIELATRSADIQYRRISEYVYAHLAIKKLDEWADYQVRLGKLALPSSGFFSITDLLGFLENNYGLEREAFFKSRLADLIEGKEEKGDLDPEIKEIVELGLSDFETYIEILVSLRGKRQQGRIIECLDLFFLKNSDSGLLRQSSAKGKPRRFYMGSRLLETLLQIAVLSPKDTKYVTRPIRIDEMTDFLRERYGLYIDRLPLEDGFDEPNIIDRQALRKNVEAFKSRLREIGFYQDLSDAYITQTVTPRYEISV